MATELSLNARYCSEPSFARSTPKKLTDAYKAGLRYEAKAEFFLRSWAMGHGYELKVKPWISYRTRFGSTLYCQPDFLLFSNTDDNLIIVETKLRHTRDCLGQLRTYKYTVGEIHPERVISLVEMCRYFDCDELNIPLLPELRPHNFSVAAVVWEPGPLVEYDA